MVMLTSRNWCATFQMFFPDETTASSVFDQWLDLKLLISQPSQRTFNPQELYSSLLANRSDNLKSILSIVETMVVLSVSKAPCERSFSAMNQIKTNLQTNMKQETLQDLMVVSTPSANMEKFNPKEAISVWVSSRTNKKHFLTSTTTSQKKHCPTSATS